MSLRERIASRVIGIGASAGAIEALSEVLPALPAEFPWPVLVVVHVPPQSQSLLPDLFASRCALPVREAEDKAPLEPATITFAPADYHLLIESPGELALSIDQPVRFSRPSIDVLFESLAQVFAHDAVGILLSGANEDGAQGLSAIAASGGLTIVQQPSSARVDTMPIAGLRAAPHSQVLTPRHIGELLGQSLLR